MHVVHMLEKYEGKVQAHGLSWHSTCHHPRQSTGLDGHFVSSILFLSVLQSHVFLNMQLVRAHLIKDANTIQLWSVSAGDTAKSLYKGARSILIEQDNKIPSKKSSNKYLCSSCRKN